jgi:hypothetical protein
MKEDPKSSRERRKHKRVKALGETYAVFRAPHPMLGQIIDISEGGLALRYIESKQRPTNVVEFDLFTLSDDVAINAVAAVARSDQKLSDDSADVSEPTRRRGIEFIGLLERQKAAVKALIQKQTDAGSEGD